jgi:integrin beta 1
MPGEKICQFRDETDFCTFFFSYFDHPQTGAVQVEVKKTKGIVCYVFHLLQIVFIEISMLFTVCPETVSALALILGIILGVLAVGVALLLIWKLLTLIHDRRQFARFNEEVLKAKWDTVCFSLIARLTVRSIDPMIDGIFQSGNPIFRPATNTYKNPVYGSNK